MVIYVLITSWLYYRSPLYMECSWTFTSSNWFRMQRCGKAGTFHNMLISSPLCKLHWLPVGSWVQFKICLSSINRQEQICGTACFQLFLLTLHCTLPKPSALTFSRFLLPGKVPLWDLGYRHNQRSIYHKHSHAMIHTQMQVCLQTSLFILLIKIPHYFQSWVLLEVE